MEVANIVSLINASNEIAKTLIWPLMILFIFFRYSTSIKNFFANINELSFKALGVEASAKRQQIEVASLLGAAEANKSGKKNEPLEPKRSVVDAILKSTTSKSFGILNSSKILWVDDNPTNNINEHLALQALGITITKVLSTEEALLELSKNSFDVIVSDMGRLDDPQAGYTLLDKLQSKNHDTKISFIIYAGSSTSAHQAECRKRGCFGTTNKPQELFQLVLSAIL